MLTPAGLKAIVDANFADDRIFAIQSFIAKLIERKVYGGGINQYRIKNTNDDTYITNLTTFLANIDVTKLTGEYNYFNDKMGGDKNHPFTVTIHNYLVELNEFTDEDDIYRTLFGSNPKTIMFLINYLADADTILPLKIYEVKIIS